MSDPNDGVPLEMCLYGDFSQFCTSFHLRQPLSEMSKKLCIDTAVETGNIPALKFFLENGISRSDILERTGCVASKILYYWGPSRGPRYPEAGLETARFLIDECGLDLSEGSENRARLVACIEKNGGKDSKKFVRDLGIPAF